MTRKIVEGTWRYLTCAILVFSGAAHALTGSVELQPGFNVLGIPADPNTTPTMQSLLQLLGAADTITSVGRLNPDTHLIEECRYDVGGSPAGAGCGLPTAFGDAWFVNALVPITIPFDTEVVCPTYSLQAGNHLLSLPCIAPGVRSIDVIHSLGSGSALRSMQHFDLETGKWTLAAPSASDAAGDNFPITPSGAYLLGVAGPLELSTPRADAGPDVGSLIGTPSQLDGTGSGSNAFTWRILEAPVGSSASLSALNVPNPQLVPDQEGAFTIELTVADQLFTTALSATDTAVVFGLVPENDHDNDGLTNEEELNVYGTDPLNADTDGDIFPDGVEVEFGGNPTDSNIKPMLFAASSPPLDALRIGLGDPGGLPTNTIVANPAPIKVLRIGTGDTGVLPFNTVLARPTQLSLLRVTRGQSEQQQFNTIVANPAHTQVLRLGTGSADGVSFNTTIAGPAAVELLRPTTGDASALDFNTVISNPPTSVQRNVDN